MSPAFEEPSIPDVPARVRRPLAAMWISLALHAAVIGLVRLAPPSASGPGGPVIEARLMPAAAVPATEPEVAAAPDAEPLPALTPVVTDSPASPPAVSSPPEVGAGEASVEAKPTPPSAGLPDAPSLSPPAAASPAASLPAAMTSPVDLNYYSARELDVQPRALRRIEPDYPADADRERISGRVRLSLKLEADGRVSDVEVVSADPPDVFDESARKAFAAARFSPAQKAGRPVRARLLIEVEYDWDGRR